MGVSTDNKLVTTLLTHIKRFIKFICHDPNLTDAPLERVRNPRFK